MVASSSPSPVLCSPPRSPRFSRSVTRHLSPVPGRLRFRRSNHRIAATSAAPERTRSPSSFSTNSLYEVLGIPIGASNDEIKTAYRSLARICHPDVAASTTCAGDEFIRIHAAYSTLSDPDMRANYDQNLSRRPRIRSPGSFTGGPASEMSSFRTYPRRNWETDQCW